MHVNSMNDQLADVFLTQLAVHAPELDWGAHREQVVEHIAPALARSVAGEPEAMGAAIIAAHAEEVQANALDEPTATAGQVLEAYGVNLRLVEWDRWIRSSTRQVAIDGANRAQFVGPAETLDRELSAFDDALRLSSPALRKMVSDQLSEMYLDLEYLITGVSGSFRLTALLSAESDPA